MKRYDIACLNVNKEILFILESKIVNNIKFHENNVCTADQIIQKLKQKYADNEYKKSFDQIYTYLSNLNIKYGMLSTYYETYDYYDYYF